MTAIARLVKIVDTRRWERGLKGMQPVPGSGTLNTCARCGMGHEVHAYVELADGRVVIMGDTCATREADHLGATIKMAKAHTLALAKARAKLAALEELAAEWRRYEATIRAERGIPAGVTFESVRVGATADCYGESLYRHLRHRTAEHFAAKGMPTWYLPPQPRDFASARKGIERIEKMSVERPTNPTSG